MSATPTEKVIAAYFAATRAMNREAWVSTFAEDGASHDPEGAPPHRGHDALRKFFDGIVGLAEKVGLTEDHVYVCGDKAAVKWTGRGIGKNKKPFVFEGIDLFEIDARGKIKAVHAYWDPAKLMAQLA
jgi:steroid delta-isomerase